MFKLGIIINPFSGIGGSVALKGSDGADIVNQALLLGAVPRAQARMESALKVLLPYKKQLCLYGVSGAMGQVSAELLGFNFSSIDSLDVNPTTAADTVNVAKLLQQYNVDLILFAGGDGTARNIFDAIGSQTPVLGVPAGVKMHSGVYAISPTAAGKIVEQLLLQQSVPVALQEVRDINEKAFREGQIRAQYYGELLVPEESQWLQATKQAGAQVDELAQLDVAATFIEIMDAEALYFIGPGSTTRALLQTLNLNGTLLGVDALKNGRLLGADLTALEIQSLSDAHSGPVYIVVTAIGGQGHIFGRGNLQFTPEFIAQVGRSGIHIIATKEKIKGLLGRPLLLDTNNPALDESLSGFYTVITGFNEKVLYPVGLFNQ